MAQARKTAAKSDAKSDLKSDATAPKTVETTKLKVAAAEPSREAVAKRAYELYLQRGSESGFELEDWLTAEAELTAEAAVAAGESRTSR